MQNTHNIIGVKGEWVIKEKSNLNEGLFQVGPNAQKTLEDSGKELCTYVMEKVYKRSNKNPKTMVCYRYVESGKFLSVI